MCAWRGKRMLQRLYPTVQTVLGLLQGLCPTLQTVLGLLQGLYPTLQTVLGLLQRLCPTLQTEVQTVLGLLQGLHPYSASMRLWHYAFFGTSLALLAARDAGNIVVAWDLLAARSSVM
eukprot:364290-Chlamydomonas_euryale.AAC.7